MIALVDTDSIIHSACTASIDDYPSGFEEDIDIAKEYFISRIDAIPESLTENTGKDVEQMILFTQGVVNFRKIIYPDYKSKRKSKPPLLGELNQWVVDEYSAHVCHGAETDDYVSSWWYQNHDIYGRDNVCIVANDKDYKQIPCLFMDIYPPRFGQITDVTPNEANYNFFHQIITGDSTDGYIGLKGKGKKFASDLLVLGDSFNTLLYKTYKAYLKHAKRPRDEFRLAYNMAKLREDIKHLPNLIF